MRKPLLTLLSLLLCVGVMGQTVYSTKDTTVYKSIKCSYFIQDSILRIRTDCKEVTMILTYKKGTEPAFILKNGKYEFDGRVRYQHNGQNIKPIEIY